MQMDITSRNGLPYMQASQADKHVTFNEAVSRIDASLQPSWQHGGIEPPRAPALGDCFLVPDNATGDWQGLTGKLASWRDGEWVFTTPKLGWIGWNQTLQTTQVLRSTGWENSLTDQALETGGLNRLGIGTIATANHALAVAGNAVFKPVDAQPQASIEMKLNRNELSGTAQISFSTGWLSQVQMGLVSNGGFGLKVSSNGSQWTNALQISDTGRIGFNTAPTSASLTLQGDPAIRGIGSTYDTSLGLEGGALVIQSSQTSTAGFRLLPFFGDIHFQNTNSSGNIIFSGGFGAALMGNLIVRTTGKMAIGDVAPSCKLDVDGPIRTRPISFAQLPSPSAVGAGAIVMISDELLGPVLAFSDGANWRRVTDRAVVVGN